MEYDEEGYIWDIAPDTTPNVNPARHVFRDLYLPDDKV
jgi:hypothetical protein